MCGYDEFVSEVPFMVKNTYRGVLDVLVRTGKYDSVELEVVVDNKKYPVIGKTKRAITVKLPKDVNAKTAYGPTTITALEQGIFPLYNKNYLAGDRTITGKDARDLVKRLLLVKSGNTIDPVRKKGIREKIANLDKKFPSVATKTSLTRAEFTAMIFFANGDPLIDSKESKFLDEKGDFKNIITTARVLYNFQWQDEYRTNYFQPNKVITIEEALYAVEKMGKMK